MRMNGDTLWLLVARSELDKDTMVPLGSGKTGWGKVDWETLALLVDWEREGQGWMKARWYCWMGGMWMRMDGAAGRKIGAG